MMNYEKICDIVKMLKNGKKIDVDLHKNERQKLCIATKLQKSKKTLPKFEEKWRFKYIYI